jgi:hypothetical protein
MDAENKTYPEGHFIGKWMSIGIMIFAVLGIPISIITESTYLIGIGPALGVGFGLAIGQAIENKYKEKGLIRPLNETEKRTKKYAVFAGIAILSFGVMVLILFYFL